MADLYDDDPDQRFIAILNRLAVVAGPDGLTIREIRDRLDERGFGLMILILSIPCLVPFLYGVPQALGVPILLLAGQVLLGREEPWLPEPILRRRIPRDWLVRMATFASKRMVWLERVAQPRLKMLACGPGERMAGVFMILATVTIILPLTNTIPSVALALLAVGLLARDGLFVAAGSLISAAWASALAAVAAGFYFGAGWAMHLVERFTG
jgi:hypothetical protein